MADACQSDWLFVPDPYVGWVLVPWMALYTLGYFYVAGLNLIQHAPAQVRRVAHSVTG